MSVDQAQLPANALADAAAGMFACDARGSQPRASILWLFSTKRPITARRLRLIFRFSPTKNAHATTALCLTATAHFLATRALVRCVLAEYTGMDPRDFRFASHRFGKPFVDARYGFPLPCRSICQTPTTWWSVRSRWAMKCRRRCGIARSSKRSTVAREPACLRQRNCGTAQSSYRRSARALLFLLDAQESYIKGAAAVWGFSFRCRSLLSHWVPHPRRRLRLIQGWPTTPPRGALRFFRRFRRTFSRSPKTTPAAGAARLSLCAAQRNDSAGQITVGQPARTGKRFFFDERDSGRQIIDRKLVAGWDIAHRLYDQTGPPLRSSVCSYGLADRRRGDRLCQSL